METATMTPPSTYTRTVRILCRAVAPRAIGRELECVEGPLDGERRLLQAGECSIDLPSGRYTAVACTVNGNTTERLQWTAGED